MNTKHLTPKKRRAMKRDLRKIRKMDVRFPGWRDLDTLNPHEYSARQIRSIKHAQRIQRMA